MKKYFVLWTALFLLPAAVSCAENAITVKARAWPKTVTMGDEIRVLVQVTRLQGFSIEPPAPADLKPFEVKSVRRLPSVEERGISQENFELIITAFKIGDFKIPPVRISYTDPSGDPGDLTTPPIDVKVVGVIKDAGKDIRPIKNVVSLAPGLLRTLILGGLAFILSLILAVRTLLRRKKKTVVDPESYLPAHERAFLEIERLQQKGWNPAGKIKEHYSEISGILKRYLERRYTMQTLDLTTSEILALLRERDFDLAIRDGVKEILEASDLVKFANWVPPRNLSDELIKKLSNLVDRTKEIETAKDKKA